MPSEQNNETRNAIKREIKETQGRCVSATWNITNNCPFDAPSSSLEEVNDKTLNYVKGLRAEIENSNTPITTDANLLTSQFLKELKDKAGQIKELTAFMRGSIHDTDAKISRLKALIEIAQEAKSRPKTNRREVTVEHIRKAKERFQILRSELHGLIQNLFPGNDNFVMEVMRELMSEHANEESNGYIQITSDNYQLIAQLKDMKIVTANPYNNHEVKLAY